MSKRESKIIILAWMLGNQSLGKSLRAFALLGDLILGQQKVIKKKSWRGMRGEAVRL